MIRVSEHQGTIELAIPAHIRWRIIEGVCRTLADEDAGAAMMLRIADAAAKGERATYDLMKLEALAGTSWAAIELSGVEGRILADDLDYITPATKADKA